MRRWRVKSAVAYEIPCGYEMQNDVLHSGKNIQRVDGIKTVGSFCIPFP